MNASILATKLLIPQVRPTVVPRPRLMARLDESLHQDRRLTLVSASTGYGKTTLIAAWCRGLASTGPGDADRAGGPVAWLSLDEGDNDPGRFLAHVVAALQRAVPALGDSTLHLLAAPAVQVTASTGPDDLGSLGPALANLVNDLAGLEQRIVLVLDDYPVITTPAVHAILRFLLEHHPPALHLVIATRSDPPLLLARLRSRDQLTEVRIDDLRFTAEEAEVFLDQMAGPTLSPEQVAALDARSEGWIAGLHLAALALQDREDVDEFIRAFTGSRAYILDYLVERVRHGNQH